MSIRPHVDRAYKLVFTKFVEPAIYDPVTISNPGGENKTIDVFPFTNDSEVDTGGARSHHKWFMLRVVDVPNIADGVIIEYNEEHWRVEKFEREDINHYKVQCYAQERLIF